MFTSSLSRQQGSVCSLCDGEAPEGPWGRWEHQRDMQLRPYAKRTSTKKVWFSVTVEGKSCGIDSIKVLIPECSFLSSFLSTVCWIQGGLADTFLLCTVAYPTNKLVLFNGLRLQKENKNMTYLLPATCECAPFPWPEGFQNCVNCNHRTDLC